MELTISEITYLKAIYEITKSEKARVTKIADFLNCSKPSVIRALKNLEKKELVIYKDEIKLTDKGMKYSKNIARRDNILNTFFTKVLKIDEKTASEDAFKIKNHISCYTVRKLEEFLLEKVGSELEIEKDYCICEFEKCDTCKH